MGGRLLDYIAQGVYADRPAAASMPALIQAGGASIYYSNDTFIFSFFNDVTVDWDELDISALTGLFKDLNDVDWTTPPTDGQIFEWDTGTNKLIPVNQPTSYPGTETIQDIIGALFGAGVHTGVTVNYDDAGNAISLTVTVTQYTNEMAMDAIAAMLAAGTHTGITVGYNDAGDALSLTCTITQYTNAMADARIAAASIDALSDVDTTTVAPTGGQSLVWDSGTSKWKPGTVAGGAGTSWKEKVRVATTANGTLASAFENGDTIDGVVLATGDRILLKNQTAGAENGIYVVAASGAPTRANDADSSDELVNATVKVSEGTINADTEWQCTTNATITVNTTALTWVMMPCEVLIQRQDAAGVSTLSFTGIPAIYDEILVTICLTGQGLTGVRVNNDSGAHYQTQISGAANGSVNQQNLAQTQMVLAPVGGQTCVRLKGSMLDYTNTAASKFLNLYGSVAFGSTGALSGSGGLDSFTFAGQWAQTAVVDRLDFNFPANQTSGFIAISGKKY